MYIFSKNKLGVKYLKIAIFWVMNSSWTLVKDKHTFQSLSKTDPYALDNSLKSPQKMMNTQYVHSTILTNYLNLLYLY